MTLTKEYFFPLIGKREITELPHEIELTIIDKGWYSQKEFHVRVKYVWDCGVGYPEKTASGCTYCSIMNNNVVRLSDGTEFVYQRGETDLVKMILNAAGPKLKLAVSDEVEFMDI